MFREITETLRSLHPSHRQLRIFGVLLGALIIFAARTIEGADAFGGSAAGIVIAVLAVTLPGAIEPIWRTLMALTLPVGWIVSRVLLIGFFYLVITPASLLLALFNKDILKLKRREENTYWEEFEENKNPDTMRL